MGTNETFFFSPSSSDKTLIFAQFVLHVNKLLFQNFMPGSKFGHKLPEISSSKSAGGSNPWCLHVPGELKVAEQQDQELKKAVIIW